MSVDNSPRARPYFLFFFFFPPFWLLQLSAHHKSNRTGEIFSRGLSFFKLGGFMSSLRCHENGGLRGCSAILFSRLQTLFTGCSLILTLFPPSDRYIFSGVLFYPPLCYRALLDIRPKRFLTLFTQSCQISHGGLCLRNCIS
jgi:hypothetical protein